MNLTLKFAQNPVFALLLSFLIIFTSCQPHELLINKTQDYEAEELFKSIVFADGKYVNKIPLLHNLSISSSFRSEEELKAFRSDQQEVINYLKSKNSNYFVEFKKGILSNDISQINQTLEEVNNYLEPYIREKLALQGLTLEEVVNIYNKNNDNNTSLDNRTQREEITVAIPVFILAAAAAWVGLYLYVYVEKHIYNKDKGGGKDKFINDLPTEAQNGFSQEEIVISILENF